jgi:hypothetical protein
MLYGEKYRAILKLRKIYELKNYIKNNTDDMYKIQLVSLVYSLTAHSPRYKVSFKDKLLSLNLDPLLIELTYPIFNKENDIKPSFLFILGFFLGDGTLHLKLEWKKKIVLLLLFLYLTYYNLM